jgi:hypothetical protein
MNELPLARVYDTYLYPSDVAGIGNNAPSKKDSINAVKEYVQEWIREQLSLHDAQNNIKSDEDALNKQVQQYKNQLLVYYYEQQLLKQKLDTNVSFTEIQKYYNEHSSDFVLQNDIVEAKYIIVNNDTTLNLDSVRVWLKSNSPQAAPHLTEFCEANAVRYSVSDSTWFTTDEMAVILPNYINTIQKVDPSSGYSEVSNAAFVYLIQLKDSRKQGVIAPVNFVKQSIRDIILNARRVAFLNSYHESLYKQSKKNNDVEMY